MTRPVHEMTVQFLALAEDVPDLQQSITAWFTQHEIPMQLFRVTSAPVPITPNNPPIDGDVLFDVAYQKANLEAR